MKRSSPTFDNVSPAHRGRQGPAHGRTSPDETPMMRQYRELKRRYPDAILLFRLGDFYEMFYEDAEIASRTLEIALTSRQKGESPRIPMAGFPHHAAEGYIGRLLKAGYKVALSEQAEGPGLGRKLMKREVVRLITPGTQLDPAFLERKRNNYLLALTREREGFGAALLDLGTAEFWVGEEGGGGEGLLQELLLRSPSEILLPKTLREDSALAAWLTASGATLTLREPGEFHRTRAMERLRSHFGVASLDGFGLSEATVGLQAAGAALGYLYETQAASLSHLSRIRRLAPAESLVLDETACRNLELVESLDGRSPRGTLYSAMDETETSMGGRLLRLWLLHPERNPDEIRTRQDAVQALATSHALVSGLREALRQIGDLERLASRVVLGLAHARDLIALRASLEPIPSLRHSLTEATSPRLRELGEALEDLGSVRSLLAEALVDDPPLTLHEGRLIRPGFSRELDALKEEIRGAQEWIAGLEARERQRTGIPALRVRFNRVFGYSIEVSRSYIGAVPDEYVRRQTLVGGERYTTPELKEYETKVLGAEERIRTLEYEIFETIRSQVAKETEGILGTARAVAALDVLHAFARSARTWGDVRPVVDDSTVMEIVGGRHPVLDRQTRDLPFVPNDVSLDGVETQMVLVTGPNMAGKSTYMRQTALLVIMAQMGAFIPAKSARIGVMDRIFTRVGARDNLARGQSTFLVEMSETANILHHATSRSLVLLDEIGRGTSTYDGLAIAWAVAEYLHERVPGAKVLFATHYHELIQLADQFVRVKNFHVAVREWNDEIIFLHSVRPGGTDRSYGIQVARLAGLPPEVIARAKAILAGLEAQSGRAAPEEAPQLSLFPVPHDLLEELSRLDPDRLTPLQALGKLQEWKARFT